MGKNHFNLGSQSNDENLKTKIYIYISNGLVQINQRINNCAHRVGVSVNIFENFVTNNHIFGTISILIMCLPRSLRFHRRHSMQGEANCVCSSCVFSD